MDTEENALFIEVDFDAFYEEDLQHYKQRLRRNRILAWLKVVGLTIGIPVCGFAIFTTTQLLLDSRELAPQASIQPRPYVIAMAILGAILIIGSFLAVPVATIAIGIKAHYEEGVGIGTIIYMIATAGSLTYVLMSGIVCYLVWAFYS